MHPQVCAAKVLESLGLFFTNHGGVALQWHQGTWQSAAWAHSVKTLRSDMTACYCLGWGETNQAELVGHVHCCIANCFTPQKLGNNLSGVLGPWIEVQST